MKTYTFTEQELALNAMDYMKRINESVGTNFSYKDNEDGTITATIKLIATGQDYMKTESYKEIVDEFIG